MLIKRYLNITPPYYSPACTCLDVRSEQVLCGSWNDEGEGGEDFGPEIDDSENWS
jgi:hypothetical protein